MRHKVKIGAQCCIGCRVETLPHKEGCPTLARWEETQRKLWASILEPLARLGAIRDKLASLGG